VVGTRCQGWARSRSSPTLALRHCWGPELELTQQCRRLLSSATRSSLITILLLQPVFFLRSASRPGPIYSGGRRLRYCVGAQYWSSPNMIHASDTVTVRAVGWRVATSGTGTGDADTSHRSGLGGAGAGPGAGARQHPHTRHSTGEGEARAVPAPVRGRRGHHPHHTPHTSSGWGKPNTLSGEISAFVCYSSSLRDNRRIHGGIFFNMPHAQFNLLIFTLKELSSQFDWKC